MAKTATIDDDGLVLVPYPFVGALLDSGLMAPTGAWLYGVGTTGDATGGALTLRARISNPQDKIWLCTGYSTYSTDTTNGTVGVSIDSGVSMDSTTITGDFEFLSSVALGGGFVPNAAIISGAAYARPNLPPLYPSPGRLLAFDMVWANNVNLKTYLAEFWGYYWMLESARTEAAGLYIP